MNVLNNSELNKLNHVEYTLEKGIRGIVERFEETANLFGKDFYDLLEENERSRKAELQETKKGIQTIAKSLKAKINLLKQNKINEIKDFDDFKKEMVQIQDNIFNFKRASKTEIDKLQNLEQEINDELSIYYNAKIIQWSESRNINSNYYFFEPKLKSRNNGQCKEVKQFFDFVHHSGGHENGWRKEDHLLFLKFRLKYRKIDDIAYHLHDTLPDISVEDIKKHEDWYKKYLNLQAKKKDAIERWRASKIIKDQRDNIRNNNFGTRSNWISIKNNTKIEGDSSPSLREKLLIWKTEKKEKNIREKELENKIVLEKIQRERMENRRKIEMRKIVNEWRESKDILEQSRKQNKRYQEEINRKRRASMANKLIKQFQSMDELHILKMRQIHKKLTDEPPKRAQSGPSVTRDFQRVMQPTLQWAHRVQTIKGPERGQSVPIFSVPKLGIPEWRKSVH